MRGPNGPTLAHSSSNYCPRLGLACGNSVGGAASSFADSPSSPALAQHNLSEGGADGRWGAPAGAGRRRSDSVAPGDWENAGVDLHNTTGEQGKNGGLFPSQSTNLHWDSHLLKNGGVRWLLHGLLAILEGPSVAFFDWCHRWRAVAPTLSAPAVTC